MWVRRAFYKVKTYTPQLSKQPASARVQPPDQADVGASVMEFLRGMDWTAWPEATLEQPMVYLRISKFVSLPEEVKLLIPTHWP